MPGATDRRRRALLLDFDGTLADTLPGLRSVYAMFLRSIDAISTAPSFEQVNGASLFHLVSDLCRRHAPDRDAAREWQTYWGQVEDAVLGSAPATGAHQLVTWARQRGWAIGIGSASRTDLIAEWLARNALAPHIDCVIGADQCERGKPDPAIYQLLVARLGVEKEDCVVIEDSDSGIASATSAGLDVIRLTTAPPADGDLATCYRAATLSAALHYLQQRFGSVRKH